MAPVNTEDFLLDLARRRRYRGLTPTLAVGEASERVAIDDSDLVLQLAMLSSPEEAGDRTLQGLLAALPVDDVDAVIRQLEIGVTLREIVDGAVRPLEGGARLQQLFYEDESDQLLLGFWAAMADSDDPDVRPELEAELLDMATSALERCDGRGQ